ncbi:hypothetical protein AB0I84_08145 [Streptomyces spectabilis]|uniref:hypothetical protein n=1 Tax=Streptomyces spectabilis TaxID=68270 RepID=UPI0033EB526B
MHAWGINGTALPTFRGTVRSRSGESGTDLVRLSALDGAERLRMAAQVPNPDGAFSNTGTAWTGTASPVWVVDHLLRNADIHTAPPIRPTSIMYASFHGGAAANLGYLEELSSGWDFWQKENAPFESAIEGGVSGLTWATYIPATLPVNRRTDGLWLEYWADTRDNLALSDLKTEIRTAWEPGSIATQYYVAMEVNFATGKLRASSGTDPDPAKNRALEWTWDPIKDPGTFHVGWWLTWSTSGVPTFIPVITRRGGSPTVFPPGTLTAGPVPAGALRNVRFGIQNMRAECFQISQLADQPASLAEVTQEGTWKRTASLDRPRLMMRSIPRVSGSAWEVITEIARATLATAEFDSDGFFRWRDHTRWTTAPTKADVEVRSVRELSKLTITEEIDACRNYCTVKWVNWARIAAGGIDTIEDKPSPVAIRAGATVTRTIHMDEDQWDPRTPRTADADGTGSPNRVVIRSGSGASTSVVVGAVEATVQRSGGSMTLTLRNRSASTVYYHGARIIVLWVDPKRTSAPSLWSAWNSNAYRYYGVQVYEHDTKGWVQESAAASELAKALRDAGVYPPPLFQSVEILPDPRIELGDVVRVVDKTGAQLDTLAWVIGIKVSGSDGAMTQTLTLRGTTANGVPKDEGLTPDPPTTPYAPPPP